LTVRILAGDIGGTHVRLALFEACGAELRKVTERTAASRDHASLAGPIAEFLDGIGVACDRAVLGVAGPVRGGWVRTTNLPWVVDADDLASRFGFASVVLLNDLEATAWGLDELAADEVRVLQAGTPDAVGNRAVVAAGTGFGAAGLYWDGEHHRPFATEAGHAGFAPSSEEERELLRHLEALHGRVSWERVVSGPGLVAIHDVLAGGRGEAVSPLADDQDPAAAIAAAAAADPAGTAGRSLRLFARLYGALAGDLALVLMATGGVWVAGGIAPRILPVLKEGGFVARFTAKGRMASVVEAIPVKVVLVDDVALRGAARRGQRLVTG
jgi:glucokinase